MSKQAVIGVMGGAAANETCSTMPEQRKNVSICVKKY
jgi:hypothetical protein